MDDERRRDSTCQTKIGKLLGALDPQLADLDLPELRPDAQRRGVALGLALAHRLAVDQELDRVALDDNLHRVPLVFLDPQRLPGLAVVELDVELLAADEQVIVAGPARLEVELEDGVGLDIL